ncbi:MAG: sulfatase-like hydrolase/transferase, partial [Planctomycetaceae bacterium]|nr:sulfatase-like hydrolase/transferase [Planctomycetaceae bacterium]
MLTRNTLTITLLFIAGLLQAAEKPNVIFIYTDDQSFNTISSLGNPIVKTPNFDRLINQGVTFTNAYNQGGWHGAICVASRSMINTGRFLWNAKNRIETDLRPEEKGGFGKVKRSEAEAEFWSRTFKKAGYATYFTGKWHVDVPVKNLFDHVGLVRGGMPPTVESSYNRPLDDSDDVWSPFDTQFKGHWGADGKHWAESLAESSIGFIEDAAKHDEPFFMYFAF